MKQNPFKQTAIAIAAVLAIDSAAHAQGVPLEKPKNHGGFHAFAFSPDRTVVAGGTGEVSITINGKKENSEGGEVILWDAKSGKIRRTLGTHKESVWFVKYSADGSVLVSGSPKNGMIKVWDGKSGSLRQTLQLPGEIGNVDYGLEVLCAVADDGKPIAAVAVQMTGPDGNRLRTGDALIVWDTASWRPRWQLANSNVSALAFSADGATLAGSAPTYETKEVSGVPSRMLVSQRLLAWDALTGKERWNSEFKGWTPRTLIFHPGKGLFAFHGRRFMVVDPLTGVRGKEIKMPGKASLSSPQLSPDGTRFIASRFMGEGIEWGETSSGKITAVQEFTGDRFSTVAFSADLQSAVGNMKFVPQVLKLTPGSVPAADSKSR